MSKAHKNVDCAMASNMPGSQELTKNTIGNSGSIRSKRPILINKFVDNLQVCKTVLLYRSSSGNKRDIHFCSMDQSYNAYFRSVCTNQH